MSMTWEAFRLTSKSPSEVLHVLGPHGVDDLIRKMMDACWRESHEATRSFVTVKKMVLDVYHRNMRVWKTIKKPTPQAFFENLAPYNADGYMRQALVLCWMMLPRTGGRQFSDVQKIVANIFDRTMDAWEQDNRTFTDTAKVKRIKVMKIKMKSVAKKKSKPAKPTKKPAAKKSARATPKSPRKRK